MGILVVDPSHHWGLHRATRRKWRSQRAMQVKGELDLQSHYPSRLKGAPGSPDPVKRPEALAPSRAGSQPEPPRPNLYCFQESSQHLKPPGPRGLLGAEGRASPTLPAGV
ncbi:putative G-Protein Coupled Receptor 101 [Manis pentadactyla]|nr:putative G-Protein Coupled Receptor 101 [Manis pentadactyla]